MTPQERATFHSGVYTMGAGSLSGMWANGFRLVENAESGEVVISPLDSAAGSSCTGFSNTYKLLTFNPANQECVRQFGEELVFGLATYSSGRTGVTLEINTGQWSATLKKQGDLWRETPQLEEVEGCMSMGAVAPCACEAGGEMVGAVKSDCTALGCLVEFLCLAAPAGDRFCTTHSVLADPGERLMCPPGESMNGLVRDRFCDGISCISHISCCKATSALAYVLDFPEYDVDVSPFFSVARQGNIAIDRDNFLAGIVLGASCFTDDLRCISHMVIKKRYTGPSALPQPPASATLTLRDTSGTSTLIPETDVPDTTAPPTSAPPTSAPPTSAPDTSLPATPWPDTSLPGTAQPSTAPDPGGSEFSLSPPTTEGPSLPGTRPEKEELPAAAHTVPKLALSIASISAIASSAASPTAAVAVGKLVLVSGTMHCHMEDVDLNGTEPLDWEHHPTGIPMGLGDKRYFMGAIICNMTAIIVGFALCWVFVTVRKCDTVYGIMVIPSLFLLPGTLLSSVHVVFTGGIANPPQLLVGVLGTIVSLCLPLVLWERILKEDAFHATTVPDTTVPTRLSRILFGNRAWVSLHSDTQFVSKYRVCFETYREEKRWFVLVEIGVIVGLAVLSVWKPTASSCIVRNLFIVCLSCAYCGVVVVWGPHLMPIDNVISALNAIALAVAVSLMTATLAHLSEDSMHSRLQDYSLPNTLLEVSAYCVAAKALCDAAVYVRAGMSGRLMAAEQYAVAAKSDREAERKKATDKGNTMSSLPFGPDSVYSALSD